MNLAGCLYNGVIYPPNNFPSKEIWSTLDLTKDFLLPPVILWNPIINHNVLVLCYICNEQMYHSTWNDGSLQYNAPRCLQDLKSHVLLISDITVKMAISFFHMMKGF